MRNNHGRKERALFQFCLPTTESEFPEFYARLEREEKEKRETPIRQYEQQMTATVKQLRAIASDYWRQQLSDIDKDLSSELAKDASFPVAPADHSFTVEDAKRAFFQWLNDILPKTGFDITEAGGQRLSIFGMTQARFSDAAMDVPENWQICFEHLKDSLNAFADGEVSYDPAKAPAKVEAPAPKPTIAVMTSSGLIPRLMSE